MEVDNKLLIFVFLWWFVKLKMNQSLQILFSGFITIHRKFSLLVVTGTFLYQNFYILRQHNISNIAQ